MKVAAIVLVLLITITTSNICEACIRTSEKLQDLLIWAAPKKIGKDVVEAVCERQYESKDLCKKVSEQLTPLAITVGVRGVIKTGRMCEFLCPVGFYTSLDLGKEVESIISGTKDPLQYLQQLPIKTGAIKINNGKTRLLHMTDIHLDLNYTANSSIVCDYPICCHAEHGFPAADSSKAPQYGSPKCDSPMKLFDSALEYITENVAKVDAAVITGDYSAHNEWQKSPQTVLQVRKMVESKIDEAIGVTLISAPGNNEYLPDHQVDPSSVPEQSLEVVQIENQEGKILTFVVLNTLFCDNINLYLIQDQTMPLRQIKTLNNILEKKENVYLLGHIEPTSKSCSDIYGTLFRAVLTRHAAKIKGQFYGHTHCDQFVVNTDPRDNQTVTSFGLLAGSLTPLGTSLPRFRVYELNNNFEITNYDDYSFSLKNKKWGKNYNFKQYYGLPIDQPVDAEMMKHLQSRVLSDQKTTQKYNAKFSLSPGGKRHVCDTFDTNFKKDLCIGQGLTFRQNIQDLIKLIQGPWGSYGTGVQ